MDEIEKILGLTRGVKLRTLIEQAVSFGLIVVTALMIWKSLIIVFQSESPIVVVLSGSMEPGFYRGDLLLLFQSEKDFQVITYSLTYFIFYIYILYDFP
jgi:signal peptidase